MVSAMTGESLTYGISPLAFLLEQPVLPFHWFLIPFDASLSFQWPPDPVSAGLWSPAWLLVPSAGLSSRSTSSSLCTGGVVEEGRVAVLPKRLRPSRDESEDRVDTRLTGRSPSLSSSSTHRWLQQSGPESTLACSCSLVERDEDNWGDSARCGKNTDRRLLSGITEIKQKKYLNLTWSKRHSTPEAPALITASYSLQGTLRFRSFWNYLTVFLYPGSHTK